MDEKNRIKLVLIGDEKTGKTLFIQFVIDGIENCDFENYQSTIGFSYVEKELIFNNKLYTIGFWDTAGQDRFTALLQLYVKNGDIIFIFFDYNNKKSFEKAKELLSLVKNCINKNNVVYALIGNKYHLDIDTIETDNIVYEDEILEYVDENNLIFTHLSILKTYSTGINELFKKTLYEYEKMKGFR